jgi:hypothetical protein
MFRSVFRPVSRAGVSRLLADVADDELVFEEEPDWRPDANAMPGANDAPFVAVSGGSWDRRLTRREKSLRAALSAGLALVVLLALVGGPGTVLAFLAQVAQTLDTTPVAHAAAPAPRFLQANVPADITRNPEVALAPVNGPDSFAYACWVDEDPKYLGSQAAPLHLALYAVPTHNWTILAPPVAQAAGCDVVTDLDAPNRLVLALARSPNVSGACRLPDLYRSGDRGATWHQMAWPGDAQAPCDVRLWLEGGALYAQTDTPLLPAGALGGGAAGVLCVTSDGGEMWRAADNGLANVADLSLIALRPDGRLLAQGTDPDVPSATALWESADAGQHWRPLGTVPGTQARVYASSDPEDTAGGGWGRLYVSARAGRTPLQALLAEASGGTAGQALLATGYANGAASLNPFQPGGALALGWTDVQEPNSASGAFPAGNTLRDASEGPSGSLLFTQPDAAGNVLTIVSPFNLLIWNGRQWLENPQVVPANALLQGVSWNAGVMRLWVTYKAGIIRPVELFTFTLSPGDVS